MPLVVAGSDTLALGRLGFLGVDFGALAYGEGVYGGVGIQEIFLDLTLVTAISQTLTLMSSDTQALTTASETSL